MAQKLGAQITALAVVRTNPEIAPHLLEHGNLPRSDRQGLRVQIVAAMVANRASPTAASRQIRDGVA